MKKDKKFKIIICLLCVIIIILAVGMIVLVSYVVSNNTSNNDNVKNDEKIDNNDKIENPITEENYINYYPEYDSYDEFTTLTLNSDNTFKMKVNLCEGIGEIKGTYVKDNQAITLNIKDKDFFGFVGDDITTMNLNIRSDGNLKINDQIGCMFEESIFVK